MADDSSAKHFDGLIQWVVEHGGYIHPSLRFSPASTAGDASGSSLITTTEIAPDTELLRCPHSCAISIDKARAGFPESFVDAVTPHALLCFFVAKQRSLGDESFWAPYIRVLPKEFDTLLYFDDEDFKFLEGCNLGRQDADKRRAEWDAEWKTGLKALEAAGEDPKPYTWDLILWAATVLTTRSFLGSLLRPTTASPRPSDSHPVLFPLVDSLNHRPLTPITWRPTETTLSLHPNTTIPASSELYNNYGPKPNAELLMGYGFTIPNNPCDTLPLLFNPSLSPSQQALRNLQPKTERNDGQYIISLNTTPLFPDALTSLFRLLTAIPPEVPLLKANPSGKVSVRNELATYSQLLMAMRMKLTPISAPLPHEPRNYRQKAAKIYREGQTAIIKAAVTEAADKLSKLYSTGITAGTLVSLSTALADASFAEAVEACFGTSEQSELEEADQEDIIFVLYLCWKYLRSSDEKWRGWFRRLEKEGVYGAPEDDADEGVDEIFEAIFPAAAEEAPEVFGDVEGEKWSDRLMSWGLKVFQGEGVNVVGVGEDGDAVYVIELRE